VNGNCTLVVLLRRVGYSLPGYKPAYPLIIYSSVVLSSAIFLRGWCVTGIFIPDELTPALPFHYYSVEECNKHIERLSSRQAGIHTLPTLSLSRPE